LLYMTHQEVALPGAQSLSVELGHAR